MRLQKPWLFLPAKLAHDLSPYGLELFSLVKGSEVTPAWSPYAYKNLLFKNRLGIAGGVDKNGDHLSAWTRMGCGFVEVGTVTPLAQKANPGIIINRDIQTLSAWNKMGFPSAGADEVYFNIRSFKAHSNVPVFVNIGKNRTTDNDSAHLDYIQLINKFSDLADAFVMNISSPNTKGLRDLAQPENIKKFLQPILTEVQNSKIKQPLFLKVSPDLTEAELINLIKCSIDHNIDGFILTNTTLDRINTPFYPSEGGVSGKPLKEKSIRALSIAKNILEQEKVKKCLISVGGVMTASDVFERIDRGADLVQVYTTLIYEGPSFFRKVAQFAKQQDNSNIKLSQSAVSGQKGYSS